MPTTRATLTATMGICLLIALSSCRTTGGGVSINWGGPGHVHEGPGHGPPPHAPAHGYRAKHRYRYYPHSQVYFDPVRQLYFYLEGSGWRMAASLPHALRLQLDHYVMIEMESDRPYVHFKEHKAKYPPGQRKKHKNKKKKKKHKKWG